MSLEDICFKSLEYIYVPSHFKIPVSITCRFMNMKMTVRGHLKMAAPSYLKMYVPSQLKMFVPSHLKIHVLT